MLRLLKGANSMPRRACPRHGLENPCSCAMGNLYRFVEPVLLFLLKKTGRSHGYELATEIRRFAFTDAEIETAALYRTLRQLEQNNCVTSSWDVEGHGPARRVYVLTPHGERHLEEWIGVLGHMSASMGRFLKAARAVVTKVGPPAAASRPERAPVRKRPGLIGQS